MASVREQVLRHFALEDPEPGPDDALADAMYVLLYSIHLRYISVDGWDSFRVIRESDDLIDAVGLMTLLPTGSVPIEVDVKRDGDGFTWSVRIAKLDPAWLALSDSKRWKCVYLYATGETEEPQWTWEQEYHGSVHRADA